MGSHKNDADIWQESLDLIGDFHTTDPWHLNIQQNQVIEYAVIRDIVKQILALGISCNIIADTLSLQAVFDNPFMLINSSFFIVTYCDSYHGDSLLLSAPVSRLIHIFRIILQLYEIIYILSFLLLILVPVYA